MDMKVLNLTMKLKDCPNMELYGLSFHEMTEPMIFHCFESGMSTLGGLGKPYLLDLPSTQ